MTDQTIPADLHPDDVALARDFVDEYRDSAYAPDRAVAVARVLAALLPAPPRPTLADMTEEERAACQWMQADVKGRLDRWAITRPFGEGGDVEAVSESGQISWFPPRHVIPRPDLPRLTWTSNQPAPTPALPKGWRLADHEVCGRGIVINPVANQMGNVCFVGPTDDSRWHDWLFCDPAELTYIDSPTTKEADQ